MSGRSKIAVLALAVWSAAGSPATAKPPGLPTMPDAEFKVLPQTAQEFFLEEEINRPGVFVPVASWLPAFSASAAVSGPGTLLIHRSLIAKWDMKCPFVFRAGCGSFFSVPAIVIERSVVASQMGQQFRQSRAWDDAGLWYGKIQKMYPRSLHARLAAERVDRIALQRLAAEAGEEQSEEPPIAGSERLTVMPREVKR